MVLFHVAISRKSLLAYTERVSMKGNIEVEIGIRVKDVPPHEVEAFLLAFAAIARNSGATMDLNPTTKKMVAGMPAVQKALTAAPEPDEKKADKVQRRLARLTVQRHDTEARRAEATATKKMQRRDASDAKQEARLRERQVWAEQRASRAIVERAEIMVALAGAKGRIIVAAKTLGITKNGLYQKMERLGLREREKRR